MIISHKYRFIFIHCRKVAGSSMKVALARHLGPNDIVIGSLNEILDAGLSAPGALKPILGRLDVRAVALAARLMGKTWPEAQNIAVKRYFSRFLGSNPPHPPASRVRAFLGSDWDGYRKFCFTRNPFERVASDYNWRKRMLRREFSFEEYVSALEKPAASSGIVHDGAITNWDMMSIDGKLIADHVGRYERLESDFTRILSDLGVPQTELGMEKVTGGRQRSDYSKLYSSELRQRVQRLFAPELDAFDYSFPY